jgi:methenyltetrahydromethanopterin cyclohydrolase
VDILMTHSLDLNERALQIAEALGDDPALFRIAVHETGNGAIVLDCGVNEVGGFDCGIALSEICMGGIATVTSTPLTIGEHTYPGVVVWTDHPAEACMASQYAGWALTVDETFVGMGSGPLRAHARVEKELFAKLGYAETAEKGVLVLEGRTLPDARIAQYVADKAKLKPEDLFFLVAPTASLAGVVQISARICETGLHKMETLGFDVHRVLTAWGAAPVSPVAKDDGKGIGRTNDCILYGGVARYTIDADDAELADLAAKLPSSASRDYGRPFGEIFKAAGYDFYKIDPLLFSPAEVWLTSARSGKTHRAGSLNPAVLAASCLPS